jgi:hypothetical protein
VEPYETRAISHIWKAGLENPKTQNDRLYIRNIMPTLIIFLENMFVPKSDFLHLAPKNQVGAKRNHPDPVLWDFFFSIGSSIIFDSWKTTRFLIH